MSKPRILIVDDDAGISRLVAAHLEKNGEYEVLTENRSFAALAVAREFRPDLVLLDVDMPGKDGGQVAAELHAHPDFKNVPIAFLTSLVSRTELGDRPVTRRGMPMLAKPVDPQELHRTVKALLTRPVHAAA